MATTFGAFGKRERFLALDDLGLVAMGIAGVLKQRAQGWQAFWSGFLASTPKRDIVFVQQQQSAVVYLSAATRAYCLISVTATVH